jgi:Tfp pilus assembly PilM family ATPase
MKLTLANGLYAVYDLGTSSVKAVLIRKQGETLQLICIETEPLKAQSDFPGDAEFRDHQAQTLKVLAGRLPLREIARHLCLFNCRDQQVKIIDFPNEIPDKQLEGVLEWEARKVLPKPLAAEPFLYAFQSVKGTRSFALAVIPLIRLQRQLELFALAGIPLTGACPEVFAATALHDALPAASVPAVSLINLGFANTHISIFHRGELRFYRHIPSGFREMAENTVESFEGFAQKIRFSFDYFRASCKLPHIDELKLAGGGCAREEFFQFAAEYFSPGRVGNLDVSPILDVSALLGSSGRENPALAAALPAIGAFLACGRSEAASTDFCARRQRITDREKMKKLSESVPLFGAVAGFLLAALIGFFLHIAEGDRQWSLQQALAIASQENAGRRTRLAELQLKAVRGGLTAKEKALLSGLWQNRISGGDILYKTLADCPVGLTVESLRVHAGQEFSLDESEPEEPSGPTESAQGKEEDRDPFKVLDDDPETVSGSGSIPEGLGGEIVEEAVPETPADLRERFLVVRGTCQTQPALLEFIRKLRERGVLSRYRLFQSDATGSGRIRFAFVGELP